MGGRSVDAQAQLWIRQFGTYNAEGSRAAAPDGSGGVYVSGFTEGSPGGQSAGHYDAWLSRYDSVGNQSWTRQFGTSGYEELRASASDGSGGVYVSGYTDGSLGGPNAGDTDALLAHYDGAGNRTWVLQFGTSVRDLSDAAAQDGSSGVFVSGSTFGALAGPNADPTGSTTDSWLARFDGSGNQTWIRQFGTSNHDMPLAVASDGSGGVYVSGFTGGDLGGPSAGAHDAWLARYDSVGNQAWIRQFGTSNEDIPYAAAPNGSGGVYVSGRTKGSLGGPNVDPSGNTDDVWLALFDSAGNQTWIRQFGTNDYDGVLAATPDGSGGVYVSGHTSGSLGGPHSGQSDAWLARYDSAGNQAWIRQFGTSSDDVSYAAAPDGSGGVFVTGSTVGSLGGPHAGHGDAWLARHDGSGSGSCLGPSVYCTAKVNSVGCTPAIGWTGTATSSGPIDDFYVTASNILNRKPGLMIWSTLPGSIPFGGGTLCLAPPVIRTPNQTAGGSPAPTIDCTGQYSFHFGHAYIQNYFLAAGQNIRAQYWSRDPGFAVPNSVGLTNGLSFVICP